MERWKPQQSSARELNRYDHPSGLQVIFHPMLTLKLRLSEVSEDVVHFFCRIGYKQLNTVDILTMHNAGPRLFLCIVTSYAR